MKLVESNEPAGRLLSPPPCGPLVGRGRGWGSPSTIEVWVPPNPPHKGEGARFRCRSNRTSSHQVLEHDGGRVAKPAKDQCGKRQQQTDPAENDDAGKRIIVGR